MEDGGAHPPVSAGCVTKSSAEGLPGWAGGCVPRGQLKGAYAEEASRRCRTSCGRQLRAAGTAAALRTPREVLFFGGRDATPVSFDFDCVSGLGGSPLEEEEPLWNEAGVSGQG